MRYLFIILLLSAPLIAAPFKLIALSTEKELLPDASGTTTVTTTTYQVENSPYEMMVKVIERKQTQIIETRVYRGAQRQKKAAFSRSFVDLKRGQPELGTVGQYVKWEQEQNGDGVGKGLGELVLQPLLQLSSLKSITAELGISNTAEMRRALVEQGRVESNADFSHVVMDHSHFGRTLATYGFAVDPLKTSLDKLRGDAVFSFNRVAATKPDRGCWKFLPSFSSLGHENTLVQ